MKIRHIPIEPKLILAPMEGVTDLSFRRLIRSIGGTGLTVTEFIPAGALHQDIQRARELAQFDPDERPISVQVYGRDPWTLGEAARVVQDMGADIVDLNMGCPSKNVCSHSGGSALLKEPDLARDIVRSMRAAVQIPFTVKMRTGWDPAHKNAPEVAWMCQEEGAEMVAVHWRTREDKYQGVRELDTIATIKRRLSIPVVANGDIVDVPSALDTLARTGADGLMIGRGAIKNPWVFREIEAALAGRPVPVVDLDAREKALRDYVELLRPRFHTERGLLGRFKKIVNYFVRDGELADDYRQLILRSQTLEEALDQVTAWFAAHRRAADFAVPAGP